MAKFNPLLVETFKTQPHRKSAFLNESGDWQFHESKEFNQEVTRAEVLKGGSAEEPEEGSKNGKGKGK